MEKYKIGDSLHIKQTNETGIIVGVVPGGYAIRTIKGEAVYPNSMYDFEKVISDKEYEQDIVKTLLDNSHVFNWNEIPGVWKKFRKPSNFKIDSLNYDDIAISKLADIYCGKDDMRPVMSGVLFDENGVTMTDAHKFLHIGGKVKTKGIISCSKWSKNQAPGWDVVNSEKDKLKILKIDGKYPNYEAVIPEDNGKIGKINVEKLLSYLRSTENYRNKSTYQVKFAYGRDFVIGFNAEFLAEVVGGFYSLGYENLYIGLTSSNRGVVISNDQNVSKKPKKHIGKENVLLCLLMPVMILESDNDVNYFGAEDLDFSYENLTYYDFKDGEIHNQDGSIADYNPNEPEYTDILTEEQIDIIKEGINTQSNVIHILETTYISNGVARFTRLNETYVELKVNERIPDGCYLYVDNYLRKTDFDIDDFPMSPEIEITKKSFAICPNRKFAQRLEYASYICGNDDMRPVFQSVNLVFSKNNVKFVSSDSSILYQYDFAIETKGNLDFNLSIISPNVVAKILNKVEHETQLVLSSAKRYVIFEIDNMKMYVRQEESQYPDTSKVIPSQYKGEFNIDFSSLSKLVPKTRYAKLKIEGNNLKSSEGSQKIKLNLTEYKSDKKQEFGNGLFIASISSRMKKAISSLSGSTKAYYVNKSKDDSILINMPLSDVNMPFNKTKPFKEFKYESSVVFAPSQRLHGDKTLDVNDTIEFAEMMITYSKAKLKDDKLANKWRKFKLDILNKKI